MLADVGLGLNFWLTAWNWQPTIIGGTIIVIALYLYAVGPLRERLQIGEPVTTGQMVAFLLGVNCIFLSLFSPLDALGDDYLFSAHMVQHLLLTIVGPPLMIVGTPAWLVQLALKQPVLLRIGRVLTYPAVAFTLYNVNFWLWHAPALYDRTLYDPYLHLFEHLTFIVLAVIYWWPVFSPLTTGLPRLSMGGQILYIFLGGMPTVALGAGLTFMSPLYAPYIYAPRVWGISPATDQQLGGLIMWVPANIAYIIVASVLFLRWMLAQERKQQEEELRLYALEEELDESTDMSGQAL
ncbi:cytochrome c oxidase assembly protein [Tengunoibacter tsumagoiensis]|uniref:Membrane protein n=1 Tax=Tengunoibacter tsumagoiensis TaxID=2014871 RepID=A0A402A5H0_9CHLR|nr:cytochrome c oxidase assembly protein [Tengunoibacter tsumagoiensis]GCE14393.1 membrane protein [Tengunoibacter tsumagoiensis]